MADAERVTPEQALADISALQVTVDWPELKRLRAFVDQHAECQPWDADSYLNGKLVVRDHCLEIAEEIGGMWLRNTDAREACKAIARRIRALT